MSRIRLHCFVSSVKPAFEGALGRDITLLSVASDSYTENYSLTLYSETEDGAAVFQLGQEYYVDFSPLVPPPDPADTPLRARAWGRAYAVLLARDGAVCHYCSRLLLVDHAAVEEALQALGARRLASPDHQLQEHAIKGRQLHIDHKIPRSAGGTNDLSNLVLACQHCNAVKAKLSYDEAVRRIRARIAYQGEHWGEEP